MPEDNFPELVLGTAMWGWTVEPKTAFQLLDRFYEAGFRRIDAATNYPINKKPDDFRRSEKILLEWIRNNGIEDLSILMKVGSISNLRTPDHNPSPAFLLLNWRQYLGWFGKNLGALMIHWDNRSDREAIGNSLEVLAKIHQSGLEVGFSGVQHPAIYAQLNEELQLPFLIQFKHNLLHSDYPRYSDFLGTKRFYAYGINGGGIKLNLKDYSHNSSLLARGGDIQALPEISQEVLRELLHYNEQSGREPLGSMNEAAMCFALHMPDMGGVLIGPSKIEQLTDSLAFYRKVKENNFQALYDGLLKIHRKYAPADRQI